MFQNGLFFNKYQATCTSWSTHAVSFISPVEALAVWLPVEIPVSLAIPKGWIQPALLIYTKKTKRHGRSSEHGSQSVSWIYIKWCLKKKRNWGKAKLRQPWFMRCFPTWYSIEKRHDRMSCAIHLDVGSKGQYETFLETLLRATSVAVSCWNSLFCCCRSIVYLETFLVQKAWLCARKIGP